MKRKTVWKKWLKCKVRWAGMCGGSEKREGLAHPEKVSGGPVLPGIWPPVLCFALLVICHEWTFEPSQNKPLKPLLEKANIIKVVYIFSPDLFNHFLINSCCRDGGGRAVFWLIVCGCVLFSRRQLFTSWGWKVHPPYCWGECSKGTSIWTFQETFCCQARGK